MPCGQSGFEGKGLDVMQKDEVATMESQIGGCSVEICFAADPVDGVIERVQSILSHAYDERVQNDLIEIAVPKIKRH